MTAFLPPNLLALFAPREPLPYLPPLQELPWEKKPWPYTGVASFLSSFEDCSETPAPTRAETREERQMRKRKEREERHKDKLEKDLSEWDPATDPTVEGDPYKTLFIGRVNFDTSESKLRREFESFGPIKKISMVTNSDSGKPRGYAFIEYEHERDQRSAYKYADGKKIDGKRVVVDIERGRTVKNWKPRRLGGGLGGTRKGAPHECIKYSGRVDERDRREGERDKDRDRDRDRDSDRRREKDRERGDRDRDRDRDRNDRDRDRSDRDRGDRDRDRGDRDRDRDRTRDKERKRERERSRSRDKKRKRSRSRDRSDRGEKKKDKDRDRESRHREKKEKDKTNGVKEEPMEA